MNIRFNLLHLIVLIGGVAAFSWFSGGFFNETEVCTHCGAIRNTRRTLWIPISEIRQTPLSTYQQSLEASHPQPHRWMFANGGGGPVRCALGRGRELYRPIRNPETVEALKSIRKYRGDAEAAIWTAHILDPETSSDANMALYFLTDRQDDFESNYAMARKDFEASRTRHRP